jgi:hypothetical protein
LNVLFIRYEFRLPRLLYMFDSSFQMLDWVFGIDLFFSGLVGEQFFRFLPIMGWENPISWLIGVGVFGVKGFAAAFTIPSNKGIIARSVCGDLKFAHK